MRLSRQTPGWIIVLAVYMAMGLSLSGCCGEPEADVASPLKYSKDGVSFDYPGNWKISDDSADPENRYITIETPGDAIVIVNQAPAEEASALADFSAFFSEEAAKNTPVGDVSKGTFSEVTGPEDNQAQTETFSVSMMGETLPHTRHYRRVATDKQVCFVLAQVSDEDMAKAKAGFELIFSTIKCAEP